MVETLTVSHDSNDVALATALPEIVKRTGKKPLEIVRDYLALTCGPGRLSFQDYVRLRLFDEAFWQGADRRRVVGQRRNLALAVKLNWRHDWFGIMSNKIASSQHLAAFGLPTIPIRAIYAPALTTGSACVLHTREALELFLRQAGHYPLFGKPAEGKQSLGSIALQAYQAADDTLLKGDGTSLPMATLVADIETHYAKDGYVLQPLLQPHQDVVSLLGKPLATARIVTIATELGPQVLRASWKIPTGGNHADNYWRSGNILAGLDLNSGQIERATTGAGFDLVEVTHHPDTGVALIGAALPNFAAMKEVALEGARVMRHLSIIGWDMASTDTGPVIVEMNETPDLLLNQLADRKGVLDDTWVAFAAYQAQQRKAYYTEFRRELNKL